MSHNKHEILDALKALLTDKVVFAMVYGSFLKDSFNAESDIDLAVYLDSRDLTLNDKLEFIRDFTQIHTHKIDVVFLDDCDLIIAMQVLANGKLIVSHDPGLFVVYKAKIISQYIDFKMSRRIIEDNMLNGRIYA